MTTKAIIDGRKTVIPDEQASTRLLTAFLLGSSLQRSVDIALVPDLLEHDLPAHFVELCRRIKDGETTSCESPADGIQLAENLGLLSEDLDNVHSEERIIERHCAAEVVRMMAVSEAMMGDKSDE